MVRAILIAGICFACWACTNTSGKTVAMGSDTASLTANSSKVLIELFTSQGCSSCPAADKLMGNLMNADTNIIALSYHVDYWDRLGWKDIFSNHDYTLRQQQYVAGLHAQSLYTPQAVVQGTYEMVGSNRTRILDAISKAQVPASSQTISAASVVNGNNIKLNYRLSAIAPKQQIVIVLLQKKATTSVARGENAGAQLADYNIVRNLIIQPAHDNGSIELYLPADLERSNASLVLFTQDEQTKRVATVSRLTL